MNRKEFLSIIGALPFVALVPPVTPTVESAKPSFVSLTSTMTPMVTPSRGIGYTMTPSITYTANETRRNFQ